MRAAVLLTGHLFPLTAVNVSAILDTSTSSMLQEVTMSRVQLALNVSDIDEAVDVLLQALRDRAGQAPAGLRQLRHRRPAAQARLDGGPHAHGAMGSVGALNHLGVEVETTDEVTAATGRLSDAGPRDRGRGADDLLLRRPGQGLGERPRRCALGGLHRARRCPGRERASPATGPAASPRPSGPSRWQWVRPSPTSSSCC